MGSSVSVTLSVPSEIKHAMDEFEEINWSGYIRGCILKKTDELAWKERMLKQFETETETVDWAVKLQKAGRKGRLEELKKKGLL
ncbi:MAG: hypothetical protein HY363_00395 [Candidatus Aenigmarchaeota archaeon]|nr:hypothetical protein [Candidatus Aenigmarchaeota archaeon]